VKYLQSLSQFWWSFVIGDDWRVAAGVALALGLTYLLTDNGLNAWWLTPASVALLLAGSMLRQVGRR
jgi:hypothetical protein